jgi:hypothetical protein
MRCFYPVNRPSAMARRLFPARRSLGVMVAIVGRLIAAAAGALVGAAVAKELDKPSEQREWHGEVGGVPYDFRRPSIDKLRRSAWDPNNPDVIVPHAFGVGWSVNFARVAEWIQPPSAPATVSAPAAPSLPAVPAAPSLPAAPAAPALPPAEAAADEPTAVTAEPPAAATLAPPAPPVVPPAAAPAVVLPAVDAPSTSAVDTPATPAVDTPATPGTATPAAAADTPATPTGPTDATGDSQG